MQNYISVKWVSAEPARKNGQGGYEINYPDGYTSWCPRDVFKKYYIEAPVNPDTGKPYVTKSMEEDFIDSVEVTTMYNRVTVVSAKLKNGFIVTKSSACIDPANYDSKIGVDNCKKAIIDEVRMLLGFLMSTVVYGIKGENTPDGGKGGTT